MKHFTLFLTINLLVMILHNHNIVLPGTNPYLQCTHVSQGNWEFESTGHSVL
jgi:hypothetical protein